MLKQHQLKIAFVVSLLLHLLFLFFFQSLSELQVFPIALPDQKTVPREIEKRLEFELVETPADARSEKPPESTDLVSDKNSIARDQYLGSDRPDGNPYSEGDFAVKNLPQDPVWNSYRENYAGEEIEPAEESAASEEQSDAGYSYQQFSREKLLKNSRQSQPEQSQSQQPPTPRYDNRDFSARDIGGLTFNTYEWDFAPYLLGMKKRIERNIFPPPAFTHMGLISGETTLRFKVLPGGEIKDLVVLKYIGHESLKETSVQAILNSAPFLPLPADFPENYLEVTANFSYYVKR